MSDPAKFPRNDSRSPGTTSMAFNAMDSAWAKTVTVLGGTEPLKAAGQRYLPMHAEEGQSSYAERLGLNVFLNLTELTLDSWVGRPFREPVTRNEDIPENVAALLDDVDMLGNDVNVFCRNWFRDGVSKAFSHVFVDFNRGPDFGDRTLADDMSEGVRPFWMHVHPERVIFAHAEIINGREVLTHLRWREEEIEQVGFAEVIHERIRVFDLVETFETNPETGEVSGDIKTQVQVRLFEWIERNAKGRKIKPQWVQISEDFMDIDEIPLVTFYADRQGFMVGKSPLTDLCDLNLRWWQSNSDQIAILTVSRFPILAASGVSDTEDLIIGPNNWLGMEAPNGRFYYVEHEAKATNAGRQDLLDLEEQMGNYGADFLKKRPGNATATARALDSAEATSPLQDVSVRFLDAAENVLRLTDKWMKIADGGDGKDADGGTVGIITEFGPEEVEQVHASLMTFARSNSDLSRTKFLELLQEFGALPPGFDFDENDREIEDEQAEQMALMLDEEESKAKIAAENAPEPGVEVDDEDNKAKSGGDE